MTEAGEQETVHNCDQCGKTYQRRDLLTRHKRRCQGSSKPAARQKACNACVQAKTKCCYSQPSCTRCAKRGIACEYPASSTARNAQNADSAIQELPDAPETLQIADWSSSLQSWDFGTVDTILADAPPLSNPPFPQVTLPTENDLINAGGFMAALAMPAPVSQGPSSISTTSFYPTNATGSPHTDPQSGLHVTVNPSIPLSIDSPSSSQLEYRSMTSVLGAYPSQLLRDDFVTPLLHWSLYGDRAPDISVLPRTSMALACGRGVQLNDSYRFMQRVMDAERNRLIDDFPSYQCIKQWDALHATMLYEFLDLRDSIFGSSDSWKSRPRTQGLRAHFLLKMAKCYQSNYAELSNPNYRAFADPSSTPKSDAPTAWTRWRITETARRTLFLINIINWCGNSDYPSDKPSPYYEAFDDDLIQEMPLPCSHQAWIAEDEEQWMAAMQIQDRYPFSFDSDMTGGSSIHQLVQPGQTIRAIRASYSSEGNGIVGVGLLRKFTRDDLRNHLLSDVIGFEDSDQFRNLIMLCACEQFP